MKKKIIGLIIFLAAAGLSGYYFYYPSDSKSSTDCNYFRRVADVHWSEAKMYDNLSQDARENNDLNGSRDLKFRQAEKQALAEKWENYYTDCKAKD